MKKYIFFILIALFAISCNQKEKNQQKKAEETVTAHIKNSLDDKNSYEPVVFEKIDSVHVKDSKAYKDLKAEKVKVENSISTSKMKMKEMEEVQKNDIKQVKEIEKKDIKEIKVNEKNEADEMYAELQNGIRKEEIQLNSLNEKLQKWEEKEKDKIYSIKHRYKAKKKDYDEIMIYEETFYMDKDGNIIEVITPIYPRD